MVVEGEGKVDWGSKLLSVSNVGLKSPVVRADSEKTDVVQAEIRNQWEGKQSSHCLIIPF